METNESENTIVQNLWDGKSGPKREVFRNSLPQEGRKISNKQPILTPELLDKVKQMKP